MRKFLIPLVLLCSAGLFPANAQVNRSQARETEWKNYALPQSNFTRKIDPEKRFTFRVPSDWPQQGDTFLFTGPHSATLEVVIQKLPEGYPLDSFFAATLQGVKDTTGDAESILTRKTQLQDTETREVSFVFPDEQGQLIHSSAWITIKGPQALVFNLKVPIAHTAEIEPFFKAVVQSVIFLPQTYVMFEKLRESAIKSPPGAPIHELENIVASLTGATAERESVITRLASLFSSSPDVAIDLLLDSRPLVRTAAVQALVRSNNSSLTPFLWDVLDDREPLVAEAAARALSTSPNLIPDLVQHSLSGFQTETIARVWPFMSKEKRNELLTIVFKETAVHRPPPRATPTPAKPRSKPGVSVTVAELTPLEPGKPVPEPALALSNDPNVQIGALTLLVIVPPEDFKLPLARIMASNYDPLIAIGLQVAFARGETLPLAQLLKLVSSSDRNVSYWAVENLTLSANVPDIPQIEALISKDGSRKDFDDNLKLAIKKINLRNEINSAKSDVQRSDIIRKALNDASLADFAWRYHCEAKVDGCTSTPRALKRDLAITAIKPFAENLFPQKLRHYTAIPKPGEAVQKFYETLHGLQMDSPRAQSNLVLMIGNIRRLLGLELSAPADAETLIEYTGIDPDSPIALGSWTAKDALDSTARAQRQAIVLRVKDRARFERSVEKYQRSAGSFTNLTQVLGIGTRAIAALPAFIPFTAQAVLETGPTKPTTGPLLHYSVAHDKEWNGLRDRMIEHIWINSEWHAEAATTHIVYVGDTAILAPDLPSIRELLMNASTGTNGQFLEDNPEFRQALDSQGDVVYFSDVKAVFAEAGGEKKETNSIINERGALKFSSSTWENSHQLLYGDTAWSKPFLPFNPKELTAPRELLPASTIAYFLTKIDLPALWSTSSKDLATQVNNVFSPNVWNDEQRQKILPELGPECGFVVLELPGLKDFSGGTWAGFCKLKSTKLSEALAAGKLFANVGPTTDVAELKSGNESYFLATRNGFLVVSNSAKGLAAFDGKTNLASTRDYSRAAEKAPAGIVALGGYNLEAAVTAASRNMTLEQPTATIATLLFSVASAFHSQHFYATVTGGTVAAHSSVSTDREGRYSVADFSYLPRVANITFAVIEPHGVPIRDQNRVSSLVLRVRAKAPGPVDNIKDDIKSASQIVEQKSPTELLVTVAERRGGAEKAIQLPVKDPELAQYLKATPEIASDKKEVIDKAREIAGKDRDAWSVARKLADWTHENLEWKLVVSANPVQTLATREADCSEFSALFVAMARSLGLPARMVSGLAYSGTAFGGHAWVEVWVGKWVELDPTWGTSFVDATHIRNTTNTLLTSAALNLIELEVLEARRTVAEFQRTPRALTEHLMQAIPAGNKSEIEATIDLPTLTDELMGAGAWAQMSEAERDRMWSAYRRTVNEIIGYRREEFGESRLRLLHLEEKGDRAEAIGMTLPSDMMIKLRFSRRDGVWHLTEVLHSDTGLAMVSEMLRPTITSIEKVRAGEKTSAMVMSDFFRVLMLIDTDSAKANALADELLKSKPNDQGLRLLKAVALMDKDETDAAEKLLTELSNEGLAPAMYKLADYLSYSDDEKEAQRSLELYQRYTTLEPHDPRGFRELANAYAALEQPVQTEAFLRKALELDPTLTDYYINLIKFLVLHDRVGEVRPLLDTGEKYRELDEDLLGRIMYDLFYVENSAPAEKLAASEPARMKTSVMANVGLARIYTEKGRYVEALRLLNGAVLIDRKSTLPHIALAMLHRKQSRWLAALRAADRAIALDAEYSESHYQRACALARLGRTNEAMAALSKAVELDPDQTSFIPDEEDLKPLASLPAFKKLLPEPEKPQP